ncbi:MAG: beta-CASP ribonuclease aCPSF1 [Candidatus Woesearchaeota archaeon]
MNNPIIKEILKQVPDGKISDAGFEGANIVLYTKDKEFLFNNDGIIKKIVNNIKKRVELRPDPSVTLDIEKAENEIKKIIPEDAGIAQILFDSQRSIVIIETEKPGVAIGKQGSLLREIKEKTMWVPIIRRTPPIRSMLIENIRNVIYQNSDYRRKFLNKIGHRIYDGWIRGKKQEWIRLTALGAGRQVGRSCFLLQTPESRILLDCGVDVANEDNAFPHLEAPEFKVDELDAVIVSHSHLDHCGFVPYLFKFGYKGPVYCTSPTRDIMSLLCLDYIKIMKSTGKEPIYSIDDVKEMVKHTITLEYDEVSDITPDVRITMHNAGHILGSSMVHMHIGNGLHNFLYTGDMKFGKTELLERAVSRFQRLETMMIESTYGGKNNNPISRKESESYFVKLIQDTIANNGKVLIPVLGVGRAQEVLVILDSLYRKDLLKDIPVYIDGMVWDVTAIHSAYPEYLNSYVRRLIFHQNQNPFLSENFKRVGSNKERKQVIEETGPCIVLATSGMLTGGPSVEYLKAFSESPKNMLIFSSYQGEGSLGKRIQRGERDIAFLNGNKQDIYTLKLNIESIDGFTGHSTRKELMNFVYKLNPKPRKIILQHGEQSRSIDLASSIYKSYRIETTVPRNLETIRLN